MGASFRIGRLFGITVRLHVVFVLLFALFAVQVAHGYGTTFALWFSGRILLLFLFVLLHELGHSLVAQAHGIRVYDIVLWPLGGLARLERIPENPKLEFKIALGGPLVNFLIVLLLLPARLLIDGETRFDSASVLQWSWLEYSLYVNLLMGSFNLIPAFPLDGGRIFRALLARQVSWLQATRAAVHVGRCFALVGGLAGFWSQGTWSIVLIAIFIWFAGGQELRMVEQDRARRIEAAFAGGPPAPRGLLGSEPADGREPTAPAQPETPVGRKPT